METLKLAPLGTTVDDFVTYLKEYSRQTCTELYQTPSGHKYFVHPARLAPNGLEFLRPIPVVEDRRSMLKRARSRQRKLLEPSNITRVFMDATIILPQSTQELVDEELPETWPVIPIRPLSDLQWTARDIFRELDPDTLAEDGLEGQLITTPEVITCEIVALASNRIEPIVGYHPAYRKYVERLVTAVRDHHETQAQIASKVDRAEEHFPKFFPKKKATRKRWKESYEVILELREEYHELWLEGEAGELAEPTNPECAEAIMAKVPGWKRPPCRKVVGRIKAAGKNGLYEMI